MKGKSVIGVGENRASETKRESISYLRTLVRRISSKDKEARPAVRAKAGRGEGLIDHVYIQGPHARGGAQAGLRCFLD